MPPERFSIYLTQAIATGEHEILNFALPHPIDFQSDESHRNGYECALAEAFLDVSWQNVVDGRFSYSIDGGKEWQHTSIPQGSYKNLQDLLKAVSDQLTALKPRVSLKSAQKETQIVLKGSKGLKRIRLGHDLASLLGLEVGVELIGSEPIPIPNLNLNWNVPELVIEAPNLIGTSIINHGMQPILAVIPVWGTEQNRPGFRGSYVGPIIFRDLCTGGSSSSSSALRYLQILVRASAPFGDVIFVEKKLSLHLIFQRKV